MAPSEPEPSSVSIARPTMMKAGAPGAPGVGAVVLMGGSPMTCPNAPLSHAAWLSTPLRPPTEGGWGPGSGAVVAVVAGAGEQAWPRLRRQQLGQAQQLPQLLAEWALGRQRVHLQALWAVLVQVWPAQRPRHRTWLPQA